MSTVVSGKRKRMVVRELVEGHESACRLRFLLHKPFGLGSRVDASLSSSAQKLVAKILRSFTHSLSVLTFPGENGSPAAEPSCLHRRSRHCGESSKTLLPATPVTKNRRGCYKRKTAETRTAVSNTMDDDHAWRKYGQKEILNFKFPRSYFRCSRKYEEGCKAVKQVQQIQQNPQMYQITYVGHHTCNDNILNTPHVVADSANYWESPDLANHPTHSTVKQENSKEEAQTQTQTPNDVTDNLEFSLWLDFKDFELSKAAIMPSKID